MDSIVAPTRRRSSDPSFHTAWTHSSRSPGAPKRFSALDFERFDDSKMSFLSGILQMHAERFQVLIPSSDQESNFLSISRCPPNQIIQQFSDLTQTILQPLFAMALAKYEYI